LAKRRIAVNEDDARTPPPHAGGVAATKQFQGCVHAVTLVATWGSATERGTEASAAREDNLNPAQAVAQAAGSQIRLQELHRFQPTRLDRLPYEAVEPAHVSPRASKAAAIECQ